MAQNLEFPYTVGQTLTATARAIGSYSGGTAADSVTGQAGTNRYLAAFNTNLAAGRWRLDYFNESGTCVGGENYTVNGNGTYQPESEIAGAEVVKIQRAAAPLVAGAAVTKTNTSESPAEVITEVLS